MRVGLVGAGRWAVAHHLPGIEAHPDGELVAVLDRDEARSEEVARRTGAQAHSTLDGLLDTVDALVVASPPGVHHAAAAAALDRGLPVLVEKPMTITAADAWDLVARAEHAGVPLMVGYTFELTPSSDRVVDAVHDLGELHLVDGVYASAMRHLFDGTWPFEAGDPLGVPDPATFADPALSGGGQAPGQLTHLVASALRATGEAARSVAAMFRPDGAAVDLHDALTVDLGGAVATFASSCALPSGHPPLWELRYIGARGTVVHDLATGAGTVRRADAEPIEIPALPPAERYPSRIVVQRFLDVVLGRAECPSPGGLGAEVVALLEAAQRSAAAGGAPQAVARP